MPPASKKGTGKGAARDRRSSSRHSTPVSTLTETAPTTPAPPTPSATSQPSAPALPKETPYLHTPTASLIASDLTIDTLIEKSHSPSLKPHDPPTARELHILHERIRDTVLSTFSKRGELCERNLRAVVQKRKERAQIEREREVAEQQAAAVEKVRKEREAGGKSKKVGQKRSREEDADDEDRKERRESLPSVGAHGLARQDGVGVHEGQPPPPSPPIEPGVPEIDPMDTAVSPSDSEASAADPPATVPLYERAFGKDPTQFDDPTIYDIRDATDDMTYEQKRAIYQVAQWPPGDLHGFTAGTPPDMDFSNAKPANQVNFSTFQTYVEPYIRPFTEEDVAFLKERGDRVTPYLIPQRGNRTYKEVWAAEDGLTGTEAPRREQLDPNVARGSLEDMNDDIGETDEVSMGPVMSRLLSVLRPQPSAANPRTNDDGANANNADGDTSMLDPDQPAPDPLQTLAGAEAPPPATALPLDAPRPPILPAPDYASFEQRAIQELKYIGFLPPNTTPTYNSHLDDDVSARLRTLQTELRTLSTSNNARRARVLELTEERMAMQEYANIADDLDNQVNAAYLKRNRSLAKPSSSKKSAAVRAGGGNVQRGVAGAAGGRGISEGVKVLMAKRRDWIDMVGPVVRYGRPEIPGDGETVFGEEVMKAFERREGEEEGEGDADAVEDGG